MSSISQSRSNPTQPPGIGQNAPGWHALHSQEVSQVVCGGRVALPRAHVQPGWSPPYGPVGHFFFKPAATRLILCYTFVGSLPGECAILGARVLHLEQCISECRYRSTRRPWQ